MILAVVLVVAVAGWWLLRGARAHELDRSLAAFGSSLPEMDGAVDARLAELGAQVFESGCAACHSITSEDRVGPSLAGVTRRRRPEWIVAMILDPDSMTESDPEARALKERYGIQMMVPGGATPQRARAVLEFLRRVDRGS